MTVVLDASALVDVLISRPVADWVLEQLDGHEVVAPAHQPAEALSAIARLVRAGDLERADARRYVLEVAGYDQTLLHPTPEHLVDAFDLDGRVRVLAALYVVVARELNCVLVTTDRRLARADPPCRVLAPPDE